MNRVCVIKMFVKLWWLFIVCFVQPSTSEIRYTETRQSFYQIAGIFENNSLTQRLAFNESIRYANLGKSELQSMSDAQGGKVKDLRLEPVIFRPGRSDSYSIWKDLCSNTTMQPIAIFGPQNSVTDNIIRDQCYVSNIPHIQANLQLADPDIELDQVEAADEESTEDQGLKFKKISINFYPPAEDVLYAYAMLLKYYKWKNFAVLYEDDLGLLRIQKILSEYSEDYPLTIRKLDPNADNHNIFKDLKKFNEYRVVMDCDVDRVVQYLTEARGVNMVNHYEHYILITMDASVVADQLRQFQSNITWLSITEYDKLQNSQHFLTPRVGRWTSETSVVYPPVTDIKTSALLMDDMANHVLKALQKVEMVETIENRTMSDICEPESEPWEFGALLQDEILKTKTTGVTGNIEFNEFGQRVNYTLYVNEIYVSTLDTIGTWDSTARGEIIEDRPESENYDKQKNVKHFYIISKKAKPYFYDKIKCAEDDPDCVEENADENYEGFSVDLVKEIFDTLRKHNFNFTYSFLPKTYTDYGKYRPEEKKWDGLIGDLLDKSADLAVCDLTITEERKKVVDFSVPFMSLGISILYIKEKEVEPAMFSFLNPYTFDVWIHTATAFCLVSIILFVCSRISPADWENPQPCDKDPEELENIWNFKNCTWLAMGSIMCQGCDILPKAIGTRWVCSMWWFFAVIVCQTYIAQLSASMTEALENEPITKVEDLSTQTKVLYGAIDGGSTLGFFKNSKDKMFNKMYENMVQNSAVLVKTNKEGVKRVIKGNGKYAFFMESTSIEYELKRNCDLKKVGEELDSKDYGIAMPANSPFRKYINRAILELKEFMVLDKIKRKWWEEKNVSQPCEVEEDKNDVEGDLEMKNLKGAFVVLIVGLAISIIITAFEFMNEVRNIVVREQVSHKEVFIKELKSSLNFFQLQKPVIRNPSRAPSVASSDSEKKNNRNNAIENLLEFEKVQQ